MDTKIRISGVIIIFIYLLIVPVHTVKSSDIQVEITGVEKGSVLNKNKGPFRFTASVELGYLDILSHTIQFGSNGTNFDYVSEGGQDVLFPFRRITAELEFRKRHNLIFLIQPFDITTRTLLSRDLVVDDLTFPEGTPIEMRYGFTFYRISYLYDFNPGSMEELSLGLSFQLRNATINFSSLDGTLFRTNTNVGPVPIFKLRYRKQFSENYWLGFEGDGFYASGKYITGSRNDFEGAILDASIRVGFVLSDYLDTFINIRYIGGGASGTEEDAPPPGDGFTDNWLKTVSLSLGFYLR